MFGFYVMYCEFVGFGYGLMLLVFLKVVFIVLYGIVDCSVMFVVMSVMYIDD